MKAKMKALKQYRQKHGTYKNLATVTIDPETPGEKQEEVFTDIWKLSMSLISLSGVTIDQQRVLAAQNLKLEQDISTFDCEQMIFNGVVYFKMHTLRIFVTVEIHYLGTIHLVARALRREC